MDKYLSPLEALLEIRRRVEEWPIHLVEDTTGTCICDCFNELCGYSHEVLHDAFRSFPGFSGSYVYPLAERARYVFGWHYEPRLRLLDHCIKYFEEN